MDKTGVQQGMGDMKESDRVDVSSGGIQRAVFDRGGPRVVLGYPQDGGVNGFGAHRGLLE